MGVLTVSLSATDMVVVMPSMGIPILEVEYQLVSPVSYAIFTHPLPHWRRLPSPWRGMQIYVCMVMLQFVGNLGESDMQPNGPTPL